MYRSQPIRWYLLFLSRPDILRHLQEQVIHFDPPIPHERVAQVSIDLLLGRRFTTFKERPKWVGSIHMDRSLWDSKDLWENHQADTFELEPGQFVLAQTLERVHMPDSLVGFVEGRSSYARIGVTVHLTAPKIDPGFNGHITLEMANFGSLPVQLRAEIDKPAQLLLAQISTPLPASELYGAGSADVFQDQEYPIPKQRKS